jgi:hypothetical protein
MLNELKARAPGITSAQRVGYASWFYISAGRSGFIYSFAFTKDKRFRVELYIDLRTQEQTKKAFDLLKEQAEAIAQELGQPIEWERLDEKGASRIAVYHRDNHQIGDAPETLKALCLWAIETGVKFRSVMDSRIKQLKLDENP